MTSSLDRAEKRPRRTPGSDPQEIEALCDFVQPEHDPKIGAIKDMAAFGVGISILIWIVALLFEIGRMWTLLHRGR